MCSAPLIFNLGLNVGCPLSCAHSFSRTLYIIITARVFLCISAFWMHVSKAFDLVDHEILFSKLVARDLHPAIFHCLILWYKDQRFTRRWNGIDSAPLASSNGVQQGSVLSPSLFAIYMDDLLVRLTDSGVGCYMDEFFCGAVCYADDLALLAPCPAALRAMLRCCENWL